MDEDAWYPSALANLEFSDPTLSDSRDWLLRWDRFSGEDSSQTALFNGFIMRLMKNTFQAKLEGIAKSDGADHAPLLPLPDNPEQGERS